MAGKTNAVLPAGIANHAEADIGPTGDGYVLAARVNVRPPGLQSDVDQAVIDATRLSSPPSKAPDHQSDVEDCQSWQQE